MRLPLYKILPALILCLVVFSGSLWAQERKPLLMEGKKTIYQKVITHPNAFYRDDPSAEPKAAITPFSVFYVYDRKDINGRVWVQCGPNTNGQNLTWIRSDRVSDWKQSMVLVFSEKAGRSPLLFFRRMADLETIATNPGIKNALDALTKQFKRMQDSGEVPGDDFPVIGMEPDNSEGAIPSDTFYLIPIFNYDDSLREVKFLDVATINPGNLNNPDTMVSQLPTGNDGNQSAQPPKQPKLGIAFVIDTTISMQPYIEATRDITRRLYKALLASGNAENTYLAFVAFRSSMKAQPAIEYTTKVISQFTNALDRASFEAALSKVEEAKVSTHSFSEDSIAGIMTAINDLNWEPFDGGVIILITDAGPLDLSDKFKKHDYTPRAVFEMASQKNIRIVTLHIKTPQGEKNHRQARDSYEAMVFESGGTRAYIPLEIEDPTLGAQLFTKHTDTLIQNLESALRSLDPVPSDMPKSQPGSPQTSEASAADIGALLGYSIRLDYLGTTNATSPPRVVRSWIADKDLALLEGDSPRDVRTVDVAVLLSRNQLAALSQSLGAIIKGAEQARLNETPMDFFEAVASAAAQLARDPKQYAVNPSAQKLGEMGVLEEFLEDLPYKSDVMNITEQQWAAMGPVRQDQFILELKGKLSAYESFNNDTLHWAKFDEKNSGEWLYRVPLHMLP
ncbi:MAG: VWA domain-containing protein [Deltaproteobacteria bacterium]|nr:VWA domain-containing protein [Deltaproteobacteria bacterium]